MRIRKKGGRILCWLDTSHRSGSAMICLKNTPAIVSSSSIGGSFYIDLLAGVLANISYLKIGNSSVKGKFP